MVGVGLVTSFWMRDEKANHAHHFLHGAVRVIEKSAFLMDGKFVGVFFARSDGLLADPGDAVLFDGNFEAVPVNGSGFGEAIFENNADAFALLDLDCWAWATSVVAPGVDGFERRDFALYRFSDEMKDFYRSE